MLPEPLIPANLAASVPAQAEEEAVGEALEVAEALEDDPAEALGTAEGLAESAEAEALAEAPGLAEAEAEGLLTFWSALDPVSSLS
jgi:hypothetical protein